MFVLSIIVNYKKTSEIEGHLFSVTMKSENTNIYGIS